MKSLIDIELEQLIAETSRSDGKDASDTIHYDLTAEAEWMQRRFEAHSEYPVVFCHNDLQPGNILLCKESDEHDQFSLHMIDFEYCSYNYRAFDIGNHLNEWQFDYVNDAFPHYHFRPQHHCSKQHRRAFYQTYLRTSTSLGEVSEAELEALDSEVAHGMALSHLFWLVWAIVQTKLSTINFGYLSFAKDRLLSYLHAKRRLLALDSRRPAKQ